MQLLKIENSVGQFLDGTGKYQSIDRITKEDLLRLVDVTLREDVKFDPYDEEKIKNQAHQIVYKSIYERLRELGERRREFVDESERVYLAEYEKYKEEAPQQGG